MLSTIEGGGSGLEGVSAAVQCCGMVGLGLEAAAGTSIAAIDGCLISCWSALGCEMIMER
jgi:hypothetical protein